MKTFILFFVLATVGHSGWAEDVINLSKSTVSSSTRTTNKVNRAGSKSYKPLIVSNLGTELKNDPDVTSPDKGSIKAKRSRTQSYKPQIVFTPVSEVTDNPSVSKSGATSLNRGSIKKKCTESRGTTLSSSQSIKREGPPACVRKRASYRKPGRPQNSWKIRFPKTQVEVDCPAVVSTQPMIQSNYPSVVASVQSLTNQSDLSTSDLATDHFDFLLPNSALSEKPAVVQDIFGNLVPQDEL